ncbi:ABC transporter permease [Nanoarchaeota archaeon]|nr:MAG: ABC transporter permease [Nanoarchaeota archaeon]
MRKLLRYWLFKGRTIISLLIIILIWETVACVTSIVRDVHFPTLLDTFMRLTILLSGEPLYGTPLYQHLIDSMSRWGVGFGLAMVVGIPLGLLLGYSSPLSDLLMPLIYVLQVIPGLAWIPIALLLFGLGTTPTIFMIFITALPPIVINTAGGVRSIARKYIKAARMLGADNLTIFYKVLIPAVTLPIINGLRIGLGNGWRVLIAAEMVVGVASGIGYSIIESRWSLDFEAAFVCLLIIACIGLIIERVMLFTLEEKIMKKQGLKEVVM